MPLAPVTGVILAGGQARRFGGGQKALLPLGGKPLLQHVIDRVQHQVWSLVLSVERETAVLEPFGLPQVADPQPGHNGPLGGLLAALMRLEGRAGWLLLVPCDAPFLPLDLAERLLQHAWTAQRPGAVVRYAGELQPTFSLWQNELLGPLETAVRVEGMRGFKEFFGRHPLAELDWPETEGRPFYNINDQASLERAERLLKN